MIGEHSQCLLHVNLELRSAAWPSESSPTVEISTATRAPETSPLVEISSIFGICPIGIAVRIPGAPGNFCLARLPWASNGDSGAVYYGSYFLGFSRRSQLWRHMVSHLVCFWLGLPSDTNGSRISPLEKYLDAESSFGWTHAIHVHIEHMLIWGNRTRLGLFAWSGRAFGPTRLTG